MSTRRAARVTAAAGKRVLVADTSNNTNTNTNNINVTKRPLPQSRPPLIARKRSPEQQAEVEVSREDDGGALSSELSSVASSDTASEFELSDGGRETTSRYFQKPGTAAEAVLKPRLPASSRGRRGKLGAKIEEAIKAEPPPELGDLPTHLKPSSTNNKRKHGTTKKNSTPSTNPPPNWQAMYAAVREMRSRIPAPVDTMGCERLADAASTPKIRRFQTLVSLMLSSQTKDTVNAVAMKQLQEGLPGGLCLESILAVEPKRLDELIHIVGFHNRKTIYLKSTAILLRDRFSGDIPNTIADLCSLPGVGPKMAHLCMSAAWDDTQGIGVDVHVHRITNMWGWVSTNTPEETRNALEAWLPRDRWREINHLLVGFGQSVCLPRGRRCGECSLAETGWCRGAWIGVPKARRGKAVKAEVKDGEAVEKEMKEEDGADEIAAKDVKEEYSIKVEKRASMSPAQSKRRKVKEEDEGDNANIADIEDVIPDLRR
ncbi:DNA glycosylase [Morchella snyderi]|nr:DNA glycosylase [Morchella snyderi]